MAIEQGIWRSLAKPLDGNPKDQADPTLLLICSVIGYRIARMVGAAGTAGEHFEALYLALRLVDVVVECRVVFANPHTAKERVGGICTGPPAPSPIGQAVLNNSYVQRFY